MLWWFLWEMYLTAIFFSFCYFRLTDHFKMNRAIIAVFLVFIVCSILTVSKLAWENCRHFEMPQLVSPSNDIWETSAEENPVLMTCHYPDLGSDASSVWNFCACFSDVISRGNQWCHREMSPVFSRLILW